MVDTKEALRYGFSLYPYSLMVGIGLLVSGTGPALVNSAVQQMGLGLQATATLVLGTAVFQLIGAVIALAGFFGALYKLMKDTGK